MISPEAQAGASATWVQFWRTELLLKEMSLSPCVQAQDSGRLIQQNQVDVSEQKLPLIPVWAGETSRHLAPSQFSV